MLRIFTVLLFSLALTSCSETNEHAKKLCDCYRNIHIAKSSEEVDYWSDSCTNMYLNIIKDLTLDDSEMRAFENDYKKCQ
jgi:hypothetical protein